MRCKLMALLVLLSTGCQMSAIEYHAARAPELDAAALLELRQAIADLTQAPNKATKVQLDARVFTNSHILVLEHSTTSPNGRLATGRLIGRPESFHLLSDGTTCRLKYLKTDQSIVLSKLTCEIIDQPL